MPLSSGTKLGPYEIQSMLGAGGMGEVYRAHDSRLNRTVAIKVLPASFSADRDRLQRFAQEARAAAALNHPNILSIFDIGEEQGAPYVVSELLEGETLRERLRKGALPTRRVIDFASQVARGLAAAHEKGIVHRDLKPENLFLTTDGRVKILDFGLAKLVRPESTPGDDAPTVQAATQTGMVMGTAGYMSPEQVRGKPADHRSDIFAFGAILYEMISGKRAFHGESAADTMSAILKEEVPEISETARNVPPGLERIAHHCLEKHPSQRFQSAGDLAFDLEALTGVSATSSKSGAQAAVQAVSASKNNQVLAVAGGIVLALAMLALGWWIGKGYATAPPAEYQQITFRTGSIGNARFTPDGSILYSAAWDGGQEELYLARTDENGARELGIKDAELLSVSNTGELAIRVQTKLLGGYARVGTLARVPLSGGTPREVLESVQDADFAADGQTMAVVRFDRQSSHWRLEYPVGHVLIDGINWISHPKISHDGKRVAFAHHDNTAGDDEGSVAVVDMQGHEQILASGFVTVEGVQWSPSGGDEVWFSAARSGSSADLRGVTLSGKERSITNVPGGMWLQDLHNGMALTVSHRERVGIRGIPPGGKEELELGWFGWSNERDLSRDGKEVLFEEEGNGGGPNYTVFLRDTDGSPPVRIGEGVGQAISPDGKWVITHSSKGGPLQLVPTGAGEARQLTHDNVSYDGVRYFPDGKQVLAVGIEPGHGMRDYVIDVNTGSAKPVTPEGVSGMWLSPDGKNTAVLGRDGKHAVWPLDGSGLRPIPGDSKYYVMGWTPDGTALYVVSTDQHERTANTFRLDPATGKMDLWKKFGESLPLGSDAFYPAVSADGSSYIYGYGQILSEAYVVKGLK